MKPLLISLLKFNAIIVLAFVAWVVFGELTGAFRRPSMQFGLLLLGIGAWCLIGNVRIIIKSRKVIANAVRDGSVEVAASALDFKDAAAERVKQRRAERAERRSGTNGPQEP